MIVVEEYSASALSTLPEVGKERIRQVEKVAPEALVGFIDRLVSDGKDTSAQRYRTWDEFIDSARRLLTVSVFRPVLPEEELVMAGWHESALTGADYKDVLGRLSVLWANCGMTTVNILSRLRENYGATISHTERNDFTKDTVGLAVTKLKEKPAGPDEIYILDCDLGGLHNFLVEVHHDGTRYLVQGYQGGYSAIWWSSNTPYDPVEREANKSDIDQWRTDWGGGDNISDRYDELLDLLALLVQDTQATKSGKSVWRQLPFMPGDNAALARKGAYNALDLRVDVYKLRNPAAVYGTLNARMGSLCVQGVLSLPIEPRKVDQDEVVKALGLLGLQVTCQVEVRTGTYKFKVDADRVGPGQGLKGKLITRVGAREINRLTCADIPPTGGTIDVGYTQAGVERVASRTRPAG
ncbi:hypothetical protein [Actinomadura alba]